MQVDDGTGDQTFHEHCWHVKRRDTSGEGAAATMRTRLHCCYCDEAKHRYYRMAQEAGHGAWHQAWKEVESWD